MLSSFRGLNDPKIMRVFGSARGQLRYEGGRYVLRIYTSSGMLGQRLDVWEAKM